MKLKKYTKVLSLLWLSAMLFMLLPLGTTAYSAEAYEPLKVEIPYKHTYTTTNTKADSVFHYIITAKNAAPLPADVSETGSFSFNGVSGSGNKSGDNTIFDLSDMLTFTFTKPGIYVYEIKADLETDSKKTNASRYTFEQDTMTITIYVSNVPGDKLELQAFTVEDDEDVKLNEIKLEPFYDDSLFTTSTTLTSSTTSTTSATPTTSAAVTTNLSSTLNPFKTGDTTAVRQYAALAVISGAGIVLPLIIGRKKGREENA